jgi:histidinol-phosphate aminotransferase
MSGQYEKPSADPGGLRLHLNENTAGCSPSVLTLLRALTQHDAAFYPDYDHAQRAVAELFGVTPDHVLLTNGLDEGILAAAAAALRDRSEGCEVLGVTPAFDMYEICADALGGTMVTIPLGEDHAFPWDALRRATTRQTRIVFLTNPHNPTGQRLELDALRDFARDIAPTLLFVDEAYADFLDETLIDVETLTAAPNLLVGRTFAKAYGLAGLRAGAVVADPVSLLPLRRIVPPYSVNAYAAAALPVALSDRAYRAWYLAETRESKRLLSAACERLGISTWPSAANFMLVHVGSRAPALVEALAAHRVFVRDRSHEAGSEGCIRITTGVVKDTRRLIAALEEAWRDGAP